MGYVLVVFVFLASGQPGQAVAQHFPALDACLQAKDRAPAVVRGINEQAEDKVVGMIAECLPFKQIPAGPQT